MRVSLAALAVAARDLALTVVVLVVAAPLWFLPWSAAIAVGRLYGAVGYVCWPIARRAGMINLRRAYGSAMTRREARRWTFAVFSNLGASIAEGVQFARRSGRGDWWRSRWEVEDPVLAKRILDDPRPRILVTAHLGSWEIATTIAFRLAARAGAVVARSIDNPFLDAVVRSIRLSPGSRWIEKRGAVPQALEALRLKQDLAILLDENGGKRGPFVPFFGRPASTRKTAAVLSLATGSPIVLGAAVRRPGKPFLYRLAVIDPADISSDYGASVNLVTARIAAILETWIRDSPAQWRWIHWRWRSRPDGTEESYTRRDLDDCFSEPSAAPVSREVSA